MELHDSENRNNKYSDTVSESKELSVMKAVAILNAELEAQKVKRPDIRPHRGILKILFTLLFFVLAFFVLKFFGISPLYILPFVIVTVVFTAKKTAVWLILMYQKFAPERIRASCVFTPTCSEYMMLAIQKYGLIKGVFKGIGRLLRCHAPNGGTDNP